MNRLSDPEIAVHNQFRLWLSSKPDPMLPSPILLSSLTVSLLHFLLFACFSPGRPKDVLKASIYKVKSCQFSSKRNMNCHNILLILSVPSFWEILQFFDLNFIHSCSRPLSAVQVVPKFPMTQT